MPAKNPFSRFLRKFSLVQRFFLLVIVITLGVLLYPGIYRLSNGLPISNTESTFYFVPPASSIHVGQTVTLELRVKTGAEAINAVSASIRIDPRFFQIISINTQQSFCSFYPDNTFDTIRGEITISCGSPSPGFLGDSSIVQAQIRAVTVGDTQVTLVPKESLILANDGHGSNLLRHYPTVTLKSSNTF